MTATRVTFPCEDCEEIIRGFADHDGCCPYCGHMQQAPSASMSTRDLQDAVDGVPA